jgi:hypothetical protein
MTEWLGYGKPFPKVDFVCAKSDANGSKEVKK